MNREGQKWQEQNGESHSLKCGSRQICNEISEGKNRLGKAPVSQQQA